MLINKINCQTFVMKCICIWNSHFVINNRFIFQIKSIQCIESMVSMTLFRIIFLTLLESLCTVDQTSLIWHIPFRMDSVDTVKPAEKVFHFELCCRQCGFQTRIFAKENTIAIENCDACGCRNYVVQMVCSTHFLASFSYHCFIDPENLICKRFS